MNPMVQAQLNQLRLAADQLEEILTDQQEQNAELKELREQLQQEVWTAQKESAVHRQATEEFTALANENEQLQAKQKTLLQHLERVLSLTKALTGALQQ